MERWRPYFWRFFFLLAGLFAALLFLTIGFWKTLLILLCCSVGYGIGACKDKGISLVQVLKAWIERSR